MRYRHRPSPPDPRRPHRLTVYFTDAELDDLRDRAAHYAGGAMGAYVRGAAFGRRMETIPPPPPAVNVETYGELARVGGNLNQLTKHLNQGHVLAGAGVDLLEETLSQLARTLAEARRQLLGLPE